MRRITAAFVLGCACGAGTAAVAVPLFVPPNLPTSAFWSAFWFGMGFAVLGIGFAAAVAWMALSWTEQRARPRYW